MGQGDSGQGSKPTGLIIKKMIILIIAIIRTVTFKRGSSGSGDFILCDMHSLMPVGFSHVFFFFFFFFTRMFICCFCN